METLQRFETLLKRLYQLGQRPLAELDGVDIAQTLAATRRELTDLANSCAGQVPALTDQVLLNYIAIWGGIEAIILVAQNPNAGEATLINLSERSAELYRDPQVSESIAANPCYNLLAFSPGR